ncbi:bifunctional 2-polyprenyl-6-hydroxyphenol methylase/3-demethylubiquinol 3-O-methyltransferase UbiG [Mucilaginibacter sp. L3T2-6]|uniref:class I SAM-dependent methyltransferase n=1 Tax=Mucilaginibacter sp. L3T2-6 TaxID=3062491 RepID=UPI0026760BEC|nr:class I SAM-dependent methyltransferase [Mucilaginibacter sp. L3T2-6]MDO3640506.1 class I SAM-dependent methyltransferase [Mucilaginibacter sp. L3T2-6]MDV6213155.1 class I SAM-dependent methyltransferase [Mucilaginibacter sp. L3T2-6]
MSASYNNSAWFYDRLSQLVYGRALINAQVYLLQFIPAGAGVLIVGGGTGWILEELTKLHPSGLKITYVEVAADMMARSRQRNTGQNTMTFINDAVEDVYPGTKFDVVLTPFLFDNFTAETTGKVFRHLHQLLKPGGMWLNCDFQLTGKWWQAVLLKSMFLFFRLICGIEASKLPDIQNLFTTNRYRVIGGKYFYGDFVAARAYHQPGAYEVPATSPA